MPEVCQNWVCHVYSHIYYACETREIYQILPYLVDFKAPRSFEIHWVREYLVIIVLSGIKDL